MQFMSSSRGYLDFKAIRETIDLREYASAVLSGGQHHGVYIQYDDPRGGHGNLTVYARQWQAHSTGEGGDVLDFAVTFQGYKDTLEAAHAIAANENLQRVKYEPKEEKPKPKFMANGTFIAEKLKENLTVVKPYLVSRGVAVSDANPFCIGARVLGEKIYETLWGTKFTIPTPSQVSLPNILFGQTRAIKLRRDGISEKMIFSSLGSEIIEKIRQDVWERASRERNSKWTAVADVTDEQIKKVLWGSPKTCITGSRQDVIYGAHLLVKKDGEKLVYPVIPTMIVVEGEIDALSLLSNGFYAVAARVMSLNSPFAKAVQTAFQNVLRVVIVADNDANGAGDNFANRLYTLLGKKSEIISPPSGMKDANDVVVQGNVRKWLSQYQIS